MDIQARINKLAASMGVHPRDTKLLLDLTISTMQQDGAADRYAELYQEGDMESVNALIDVYVEAAGGKIRRIIETCVTKTGAKEAMAHRVLDLIN
jgi:hypothetical protein